MKVKYLKRLRKASSPIITSPDTFECTEIRKVQRLEARKQCVYHMNAVPVSIEEYNYTMVMYIKLFNTLIQNKRKQT